MSAVFDLAGHPLERDDSAFAMTASWPGNVYVPLDRDLDYWEGEP